MIKQPYTRLQIVIICAVLAFLILVALWLSACTASKVELLWIEGADCTFVAEGLTAEQATDIRKAWHLGDCPVASGTTQTAGHAQ